MKSIVKALNNIAQALNSIAASISSSGKVAIKPVVKPNVNTTPYPTSETSNPISSTKITTYLTNYLKETVRISEKEYEAVKKIYKAVTDKGNHPDHHDHTMREIRTKWPTLYFAIQELIVAHSYDHQPNQDIWKYKNG